MSWYLCAYCSDRKPQVREHFEAYFVKHAEENELSTRRWYPVAVDTWRHNIIYPFYHKLNEVNAIFNKYPEKTRKLCRK